MGLPAPGRTRCDGSGVGGKRVEYFTDGEYALAKDVKTGIQDNNYIEITAGVEDSARVISAPFSAISKKLSDSTLIEIIKKEDLYKEK